MKLKPVLVIFLFLVYISMVSADDQYKPYLHKASVPEHPKVKMYGTYTTNLFPGAATYSYPIEVPKGTNGLQPSISLYYNSQNVKQRAGIVSAGGGITESYIYRDVNYSLTDTSDDKFKLVLMGSSYDLAYDNVDGLYHTKTETYMRIRNYSGVDYWIITDRDGAQYRFGYNSDSEVTSNTGKGYSLFWYLDKVTDSHVNNIYYTYRQNSYSGDKGAIYLSEIKYNNDLKRKISFSYTVRDDTREVYEQGNDVNYNGRLSEINVFANDALVRKYNVAYTKLNTASSLSSIGNITLYGNNNITVLNKISFDYSSSETGYNKNTTLWKPPVLFSNEYTVDFGVRLADLNNDGFVDFLQGRQSSSEKKIWLNNKNGNWGLSSLFALPMYFVDGSNLDLGVRLEDFNKDGLIDILQGTQLGGNTLKAYRNNGTGFIDVSSTMAPPIYFTDSSGYDMGVQLADLNGDGYTDIIQSHNNGAPTKKVYLNNKSNGWIDVTSAWTVPTYFMSGNQDTGARIVDFNADGLADIIEASNLGTVIQKAWLNNGTGWHDVSATWKPLTYFTTTAKIDNGDRFADLNGDGLVDIFEDYKNGTETSRSAWLNTGHGWSSSSSWQSPEPFTFDGNNIGRRIADVNGDGFADILVAYGNNSVDYQYTWVKNDTIPYLLKSITNSYGGVTNLTYNSSTKFNNTGNDSISDIGFNIYVVANVENNNSMNGLLKVTSNTNYTYSGGRYDYADSEFRGFNNVNETKADNTHVNHYFYQDSILKGKEYKTEVYDSLNNPYTKEEKAFRAAANLSYYRVFLDSVSTYSYEGNSLNPLIINVSYTYNDYGDVLRKYYHGDANLFGDERWEDYVYYYNSTNWIMGKVRRYELENNFTISKATWYSYDGLVNDGPQSKGDLTRVENWNSKGSNPVTNYEYDNYGNLIKEIDSLGRITTHYYCNRDATCTYKDKDINALGHITDYNFDLGTGNLIWEEKNNIRKNYYYDVFGRLLKEVKAYDDASLPTVGYTYTFDGTAPEVVKVSKKAAANNTLDSYYYYDGFLNLVQVRSSASNNQQTVKDLIYDGMFRVKSESHPYFMNFNLTLNVGDTKYTNYTYDALSRVTLVKNADGTNKTVLFSKSNVTAYDENGHRHKYLLDSYGRISNVYEYNNDPILNDNNEYIYNTSYYYDLQDNLVKITDTLGNNFIFGFDSLGRKTSMDDPDLGKWYYGYDANNNLVNQIDAKNNYVNLSYDSLNRVLNKAAANGSINFSYDGQYFGTLSNVTYGNEVYRYTYDEKYRVVLEEVYLRSRWFNTGKTYDSMDRLIEQRVPNGTSIDYMYNAQGLIDKIPDYVSSTNYNAFGNPLNRTFSSNNVMAFTYDADSARLSTIVTGTLQDLAYSYDNTGNIIQIYDSVNNRRQKMTYDFLDRLSNATINNSNYRYVYDETGSIIKIVNDYNVTTRFAHLSSHKHAPSSVVNGTAGVMVYKVKQLNIADKNRTVEFYLINERNETLNNVNWTVDFGDGNLVNSSISVNLSVGQNLMIIVGHSYANAGDYNISVRASYANNTDSDDIEQIKFGIKADALLLLNQNITNTTFEFKVRNDMAETASNINWSCDNGISSSNRFNLTGNETIFIYIASNYSTPGSKSLNCNATSSNGNDSKTLGFNLRGVEFVDYNSTIVSGNKRMVNMLFRNYFLTENVNWTILSDGQLLSGTESVGTNNYSLVSHQINYTTQGLKTINSNITTTTTLDNRTEMFVIKGLEIENYFRNNKTDTDTIFSYTVKNYWDNMSVNWSFTTPSINSQTKANLSYNETLFVFVEENYTSSGTKDINFTIFNGTMSTSFIDRLVVNIVEVVSNLMLYGSPDLSISEFVVKNHISPFNISWRFSTGTENITSNQNIVLNNTAFVIIASNYSSTGVYTTEAYVNSSLYNSTRNGVVIA